MARKRGAKSIASKSSDRLLIQSISHYLVVNPESSAYAAILHVMEQILADIKNPDKEDFGARVFEPDDKEREGNNPPGYISSRNVFLEERADGLKAHQDRIWEQITEKQEGSRKRVITHPDILYILRRRNDPDFRDFWFRDHSTRPEKPFETEAWRKLREKWPRVPESGSNGAEP